MQQLNNVLNPNRYSPEAIAKRDKVRHIQNEWMAFAFKTWKEYSNESKELPNVIRFFKTYKDKYRPLLDNAYNFCTDYTGNVPKIKLFYWKFWDQYKKLKATAVQMKEVAGQKSPSANT